MEILSHVDPLIPVGRGTGGGPESVCVECGLLLPPLIIMTSAIDTFFWTVYYQDSNQGPEEEVEPALGSLNLSASLFATCHTMHPNPHPPIDSF